MVKDGRDDGKSLEMSDDKQDITTQLISSLQGDELGCKAKFVMAAV